VFVKKQRYKLWFSLIVASVAGFMSLVLAGWPAIYAACQLNTGGDFYPFFVGGHQNAPNTPTGIVSSLWNYNPVPVRYSVSFWVMLERFATANRWAQVGWRKTSSMSTENIFLQYHQSDNSSDYVTRYLNCASNTWGTTPACEPSSMLSYWVFYAPSTKVFEFRVNGYATYQTNNVGWTPDHFTNMGEIKEGDVSNQYTDKGRDHSPGHDSNRIHSENVMISYVNSGGWVSANLTRTDPSTGKTMHYQKVEDVPGWPSQNWFRIWDARCNE